MTDPHFAQQNLPLYATEAATRDRILSNVKYDLVLALSKDSDTYHGKLKTEFCI